MKTPILKLKKNRFGAFRAFQFVGLILLFAGSPSGVNGTPLNRFRILVDTNQMNVSEINQMNVYTYNPLAVDGVWAITQNHCGLSCTCVNEGFSQNNPDVPPSLWPNVFLKLNGATWTISEDEANWFLKQINNNARVAAQSYIYPSPVRESLAYYEYFPLLPPGCENDPPTCGPNIDSQQIESEVPLFGDRIIFLSRNYRERKPVESGEAYWVREGLTAPHGAGVVFEINPGTIANDVSPDFNKAVDGINYTLSQGKNCYLLLPPNWNGPPPYNHRNNDGGPPDYAADIQEVITYLNGKVPLDNPNLFIVLAVYGRDDMPPPAPPCSPTPPPAGYVPSGPGFLTGQGTTGYNNSVLAAARALQTFRNSILPQGTIGFIDSVTTSGASGWTLDPETFAASAEAIAVHLYVNGPAGSGTFVGAATANISRPDVNTATGFLGNHGFNVPIPPAYLDGQWHQWFAYGISASGQPGKNTLLGNSPIITILPDNIPPTVSLLGPANNAHVRGTVTIGATADDNVAVVGVQFRIDGANFGPEVPPHRGVAPDPSSTSGNTTSAASGLPILTAVAGEAVNDVYPFSISWNTIPWAPGLHTLTAVARDAANNLTTSASRTVTVDNTAPTGVAIINPLQNTCVGGTVTVTASASDPNMASVQFKLDGNNLGAADTTAPYSVVWNTTTATQTVHTLTAVAKDLAGNTTTSPNRTVTVDNTSPTGVAITAPANGSTVAGVVTVSATASDNCALIGVQFTLDGVNLGTLDKTVPYSISWNTIPVPSGPHTLRAVAIDQAGNPPTTSAPVNVTVNNNSDQ